MYKLFAKSINKYEEQFIFNKFRVYMDLNLLNSSLIYNKDNYYAVKRLCIVVIQF